MPYLAGQEVEQLVTYPIEQSVANLPDLAEFKRSISRFGLSVITVVFDDKVDIYFARQLINEKLKRGSGKNSKRCWYTRIGIAPVSTGWAKCINTLYIPKKEAKKNILQWI